MPTSEDLLRQLFLIPTLWCLFPAILLAYVLIAIKHMRASWGDKQAPSFRYGLGALSVTLFFVYLHAFILVPASLQTGEVFIQPYKFIVGLGMYGVAIIGRSLNLLYSPTDQYGLSLFELFRDNLDYPTAKMIAVRKHHLVGVTLLAVLFGLLSAWRVSRQFPGLGLIVPALASLAAFTFAFLLLAGLSDSVRQFSERA
jgi:hypothetical protein